MPSIEIACIGLNVPLKPPATTFAVVFESGLISHRYPSLFKADFDQRSGCLYHLGNPAFANRENGAFFAYELLSEEMRGADPPTVLEFSTEHAASVQRLITWLLDVSPVGEILFTSDWQSGPPLQRFGSISLLAFWELHTARKLSLNAAYKINRGKETRF